MSFFPSNLKFLTLDRLLKTVFSPFIEYSCTWLAHEFALMRVDTDVVAVEVLSLERLPAVLREQLVDWLSFLFLHVVEISLS